MRVYEVAISRNGGKTRYETMTANQIRRVAGRFNRRALSALLARARAGESYRLPPLWCGPVQIRILLADDSRERAAREIAYAAGIALGESEPGRFADPEDIDAAFAAIHGVAAPYLDRFRNGYWDGQP